MHPGPGVETHPIEAESYRILEGRVDLSHLGPGARAVVSRVIHASADVEYARTMAVDERAVHAGVEAIKAGAPVIADVEMVRCGINDTKTVCYLDEIASTPPSGPTRSSQAMALAARRHPTGAVVVVGCAPTALVEALRMAAEESFAPALVVGLPVGFVGAAEAKEAARGSGLHTITNIGEKGGSAVAAAVVNGIVRLSRTTTGADPRDRTHD